MHSWISSANKFADPKLGFPILQENKNESADGFLKSLPTFKVGCKALQTYWSCLSNVIKSCTEQKALKQVASSFASSRIRAAGMIFFDLLSSTMMTTI